MADNPVSWLLLTIFGIYFICRFLWAAIKENNQKHH